MLFGAFLWARRKRLLFVVCRLWSKWLNVSRYSPQVIHVEDADDIFRVTQKWSLDNCDDRDKCLF